MNERILELWHQATLDPTNEDSNDLIRRFAELIIQECAGIVTDAVDHREPASTYVGKIKENFGVE